MKKYKLLFTLIFFASVLTLIFSITSALQFSIVFCNVGQGAATLIQAGLYQAVIDTGPDGRILSCIGQHIPFFDHTIETVIISHNQKDHNGGLLSLYNKYQLLHIYGPLPKPSFIHDIPYTEVRTNVLLRFVKGDITINKASQSSNNLNTSANVVTVNTPRDVIFLSSDIDGTELKRLMPSTTTILEVPHHGSKYGLYPDSLNLADITYAVISVGQKNTYGHPSREVLDILKAKNIPVWRTDRQGELVVDLN